MVDAGKSAGEAIAAKPAKDLDADWGKGFLNGGMFTRVVYEGLRSDIRLTETGVDGYDGCCLGRESGYWGGCEMLKIKRKGSAVWEGGIKDGKGAISTESGALAACPYGFASRFEGQKGSNPEELIGAAHASCFTMALSLILGEAKLTAEHMETSAEVTLEQVEGGYAITAVRLTLKAKIPGADQATFDRLTTMAKAGCPVSKLLKADITLDATLLE